MKATQHFTSRSVSMTKHCNQCARMTPHRVNSNHKAGACLLCLYANDPRILSRDELTVLGISETQFKLDVWKRQSRREAEAQAVDQQGGLFA